MEKSSELLKGFSHQGKLEEVLFTIFPTTEWKKNARKEAEVRDQRTGYLLELDYYLPDLHLCFEFQDAYHYVTTWYAQSSIENIRETDGHKKELVHIRGETLIQVPCWWDGSAESMAASIHFERPDKDNLQLQRGDILTVSYENFSRRATLVNPKIVRVRKDISWKSVLESYAEDVALNGASRKLIGFTSKPAGFWSSGKGKNVREFFESFAKARDFDPLDVENWYSLSTEFMKLKGGRYIVAQFKGGFAEALQQVFPEIKVERGKFALLPKNFWTSVNNRKRVLIEFAAKHKFDPLIANNWYSAPINEIYENMRSMLNFYGHSVTRAIMHLFPDIGVRPHLFKNLSPKYWLDEANQRQFFLDYAKSKDFDPLVPANWYYVSVESFRAFKKSGSVLAHYGGNLRKALFAIFPNIGLDKSKFHVLPAKYWESEENRRNLLVNFAQQAGFDPLLPENWYAIPAAQIRNIRHARSMLGYHKGSVVGALITLFPAVKFDITKFPFFPKSLAKLKRSDDDIK